MTMPRISLFFALLATSASGALAQPAPLFRPNRVLGGTPPRRRMNALATVLLVACGACTSTSPVADLIIRDASVFDARTGRVASHQMVVVRDGVIDAVVPDGDAGLPRARATVEAQGRLLTPGFFDVHYHTDDVLGDSMNTTGGAIARLSMDPASIARYRRAVAALYLPYGVTVIREAGGPDESLPLMRAWMDRVPWAPDAYPSGGALVSFDEGREPYPGHTVVRDPDDARRVVRAYHDAGFRHVKLYWRLREPEFRAALEQADALGMVPYAHVDNGVVSVDDALRWGLRRFEHAHTLAVSVLRPDELADVWQRTQTEILEGDPRGAFFMAVMERFNELGDDDPRMVGLVDRLAEADSFVTPTLQAIAGPLGVSSFQTPPPSEFADTSGWTEEQRARAHRGYRVFASYVRRLHEAGVTLALGTDTPEPGRSALAEMLLLHDAGISMADTLQIATLNSARSLGLDDLYGTVEPGKRADFVLFDESPLDRPSALLGPKTVIKDGVTYAGMP